VKCSSRSRLLFFLLRDHKLRENMLENPKIGVISVHSFPISVHAGPLFSQAPAKVCKVGTNTIWDRKRALQFPFMYILETERE
jgi:hypothetical protein